MLAMWKYPLEVTDEQYLEMPKWARLLYVATQAGQPCVWALVDTEDDYGKRLIRIHGTGHPVLPGDYVGSFQMFDGALVFHVFDGGVVSDE